tara:strand:+ start:10049 stop:10354 length:306 start_codon:yes stop_codon:yes gene_type:complete
MPANMLEHEVRTVIVTPEEPMPPCFKGPTIEETFRKNGFNIWRTLTEIAMSEGQGFLESTSVHFNAIGYNFIAFTDIRKAAPTDEWGSFKDEDFLTAILGQ